MTNGQVRGSLTQTFLAFLSILSRTLCKIFLKLRRQWQIARARVALVTFSLATEHFSARGGPDLVLGYRFRLPAANFHDLIHHRPGQRFAEGTSHAEGMHRKIARQPCHAQVGLQGGRHTSGGERQATPAPFGRNYGEQVPGG